MEKEALLKAGKDRLDEAVEGWSSNQEAAKEDLEFQAGKQWPDEIANERRLEERPMLTVNLLRPMLRKIIGDQRQNKVAIKMRPADSKTDKITARIYEGITRNIQYQSKAPRIYLSALEQALSCGFGFFRIITEYEKGGFDQEIRIESIPNQFSVFPDPKARKANFEDMRYCFITEVIDREDFREMYPDAQMNDVETNETLQWWFKDTVRVAEYFYLEPTTRKLALLSDGQVVELTDEKRAYLEESGIGIVKERDEQFDKVMWLKMSGVEVLEGPIEFPSEYIPVIVVPGDEIRIENERMLRSIIRDSKDPQRMYNYWATMETELIALAPKSPFLVTPEEIEGHETMWAEANRKNRPYLLFNAQSNASGRPQRQPQGDVPQAVVMARTNADREVKATSGIWESYLGEKSNEVSGKAILARAKSSDISIYIFIDNFLSGIEHAGRIIVGMIPRIYDTERAIRIMGDDDKDEFIEINKTFIDPETGEEVVINDLSVAKLDVVVEIGPSYQTQRQEAADSMMAFIQYAPNLMPLIADLVAENMDWPNVEKFVERLRPPEPKPQPPDPEKVAKIKKIDVETKGRQLDNVKKIQELTHPMPKHTGGSAF